MMNRSGWLIILALTLGFSSLSPAELQGEKTDSTGKPELETGIEQACELILDGNLTEAAKILEKLKGLPSHAGEVNFYLGLTALGKRNLKRAQAITVAASYFETSARAGYSLSSEDWENYPIKKDKYCDANWKAAKKLIKSKDPEDIETTENLLKNIMTVELKVHNACRELGALEKDSLACSYYSQCQDSLDEVTAGELLRDVTDIVFEDDRLLYENAATLKEKQAFFRRLWKSRDPSLATDYNKRLAEHYRRLNHAKQNFHINMINGYDDRGRIYIKHGEPDQKVSDFVYERENVSWLYRKKPRDFIFHFLRRYTNHEILPNLPPPLYESRGELDLFYSLAAMKLATGPSRSDLSELMMDENEILEPAFTLGETTETYNPYKGIQPLDYYFYTADFMSRNANSSLYVYYGLPVNKLELLPDSSGSWVDYECAITLFDQEWNQVARAFDERNYLLRPDPDKAGKGSLVIDRQVVSLPPGQYYYTVSVEDLNSGHLGIYRDTVEVTPYEHGRFNVSQIVLTTNITQVEKGQKPGKFARGRLNVMALPSRTFRRDQKVFIYCEIYYLNKDNQGKKRYNIDFSIKADKLDKGLASKIFTPFGKLLGKKEDISSITLTFDKEQENPDRAVQQEYISIDIIESPPGKYDLNITVTDNATGEKVTRDASFSIVKAR